MSFIKSIAWVAEYLRKSDTVIVDCRFALGQPASGEASYAVDHIPGAIYFDLERDLSAPVGRHGGRHPLPDFDVLADKLGQAGIGAGVTVVAYDNQGGAMASRFWWLLRFMGHRDVFIMDGGYSAWKGEGYPVTAEIDRPGPRLFIPKLQLHMLADMEEVRAKTGSKETMLVDSREEKRYLGIEEPIDPIAGHIPSAKNFFWKDGLDGAGCWKPAEVLRHRFAPLADAKEIIVYCGSGVTACPNVLALEEAGFTNVKLYAGSWSDWISYKENPIATGKE